MHTYQHSNQEKKSIVYWPFYPLLRSFCSIFNAGAASVFSQLFFLIIHNAVPTRLSFPLDSRLLFLQIGDFGLSRNLEEDDYYTSHGGKIPVRWTAPEVNIYDREQ